MEQTLEESFSTVYFYLINRTPINLICYDFCLASLQYKYEKLMCKLASDTYHSCSEDRIKMLYEPNTGFYYFEFVSFLGFNRDCLWFH